MGSRSIYTTEDYATRILLYLHKNNRATTTQIIKEVTGTSERLMDGLVWLILNDEAEADMTDKFITRWSVKEEMMWTQ